MTFPSGIYGIDLGRWVPKHYQDPSALMFAFNNTSVPINVPYNSIGNEILSCWTDPTLDGDNRLHALRTNFDVANTIAQIYNPNSIFPFNIDQTGIV